MNKSKYYKITLINSNVTQKNVAKILNYTESYVSMLIAGKRVSERFDNFIKFLAKKNN